MQFVEASGVVARTALPAAPAPRSLLRFITCGSVDDGKSTLIGRLLHDTRQLPDDQMASLAADSRTWGTQQGKVDFALLVDGLAAEREQGITIDVAYRYFGTERRKFIVADTPGHEQYTRNMFTGASTADAAVLLVDARKGILTQTRRHSLLVSLIGIRSIVLAVNKMDLVDWSRDAFEDIRRQYLDFVEQIGPLDVTAIPMSALGGDNLLHRSSQVDWYAGPTLMEWLEAVPAEPELLQALPLRLPVQCVVRPDADFRGYAGTLVSGSVRPGDRVRVMPGGQASTVSRIVTADGDLAKAGAGQAVTLTLADEIDVSRGDVISAVVDAPSVADQFEATLVWLSEEPMLPGRSYLFKLGTVTVNASVTEQKHRLNVNTLERLAAKTLSMNEIGVCNLSLDRPVAHDPYVANREMGGFILIDRLSGQTVGAGMLHFALRRAHNIHRQHLDVNKDVRAGLKAQRAAVVWLTGLSGAGKSTIANAIERRLVQQQGHTYLLDGDNLRHGVTRDLGFSSADRVENIRRVAEIARLMVDAGLIVIVALISPFRSERAMARGLLGPDEFIEVHVDAPLSVVEARDVKGLYAKARQGDLANFTGISSPYEPPEAPELRIDTTACTPDEAADQVIRMLIDRGLLAARSG
jgi:bifunctional enzyme CysN/CysC